MLQYINALIQKIKSSEKGQGMVEYALIIAFVAAIAIFVLSDDGLGGAIGSAFENASTMIEGANEAATSIGK
ncbi:MAG: pilin protein [Selenomonadaceae bacterium]|nr:pilin protein [Selenomonadaceae bacterium]